MAANNRVSQSVPHFHVHVVPRRPRDGLRGFFWPRTRYRDAAHAEEVAARLRALGVGPESRVVVLLERGPELAAALLGVLKAGGAYVPLDPAYPRERLAFMLEDARAQVLLTQEHLLERLADFERRVFCFGRDDAALDAEGDENLPCVSAPDNLAYLIYTSGSTGRPKGVAMTQRPLLNLLRWQAERAPSQSPPRTLRTSPARNSATYVRCDPTSASAPVPGAPAKRHENGTSGDEP